MKNLLTTSIDLDADTKARWSDLFEIVLEAAPPPSGGRPGGLTPGDMLRRLPVLEKVRATGPDQEFAFSAEEIVLLRGLWDAHRWGKLFPEVVQISEALREEAERS